MSHPRHLTYDAVVATRNRPHALKLSLPLLVTQSRPPEKVIVVDASDDATADLSVINGLGDTVPVEFIRSRPGLALQRNAGLARVTSDVVFFPDDDSLVLPEALDRMMRVYELDEEEAIGGVCSAEADAAPDDIMRTARSEYRMGFYDVFKRLFGQWRNAFEDRYLTEPYKVHAHEIYETRSALPWFGEENVALVEYMTGFRMSYRSALIRRSGFDETLGAYALGEDVDASFGVLRTHLLAGARNAAIFHYRVPGPRAPGREVGAMHILNRAYILAKHAAPTSRAIGRLKSFSRYKIAQYALRVDSSFGRARLKGALAAHRRIPRLLAVPPARLAAEYGRLFAECVDVAAPDPLAVAH
ncbi:MAG: glycosyltransferase family 2 protein [Pararhizobium sp.]